MFLGGSRLESMGLYMCLVLEIRGEGGKQTPVSFDRGPQCILGGGTQSQGAWAQSVKGGEGPIAATTSPK